MSMENAVVAIVLVTLASGFVTSAYEQYQGLYEAFCNLTTEQQNTTLLCMDTVFRNTTSPIPYYSDVYTKLCNKTKTDPANILQFMFYLHPHSTMYTMMFTSKLS
ncbi:uncharacterized protein LOC144101714 [Amblyomma americanum]